MLANLQEFINFVSAAFHIYLISLNIFTSYIFSIYGTIYIFSQPRTFTLSIKQKAHKCRIQPWQFKNTLEYLWKCVFKNRSHSPQTFRAAEAAAGPGSRSDTPETVREAVAPGPLGGLRLRHLGPSGRLRHLEPSRGCIGTWDSYGGYGTWDGWRDHAAVAFGPSYWLDACHRCGGGGEGGCGTWERQLFVCVWDHQVPGGTWDS